jgi:hypothetical protein
VQQLAGLSLQAAHRAKHDCVGAGVGELARLGEKVAQPLLSPTAEDDDISYTNACQRMPRYLM